MRDKSPTIPANLSFKDSLDNGIIAAEILSDLCEPKTEITKGLSHRLHLNGNRALKKASIERKQI